MLTAKINTKKVFQAIKDNGFKKSPFPIFISLESHCSEDIEKILILQIKEIFDNQLYNLPNTYNTDA